MYRSSQLFLWLLIAIVLSGCEQSHPEYFGTIRPRHGPDELWMNNGEPQWIDPNKCSDGNGGDVIWNTFAGLVAAHPATLEPVPEIAKSWDVSDDGLVYTFHLRESKWSDGHRLTAEDFVWSWRRLADPATSSKYGYISYEIVNAEAFNSRALFLTGVTSDTTVDDVKQFVEKVVPVEKIERSDHPPGFCVYLGGDEEQRSEIRQSAIDQLHGSELNGQKVSLSLADGSLVGVQALDDLTLQVRLRTPIPYFLDLASFYSFAPVPRHLIERLEAEGLNPDLWTRPEHIVSNGPYLLREWKFRQFMLFEKNPLYWDVDQVRIPTIKAYAIEIENTSLNMYHAGEIEYPGSNTALPSEFMDHLRQFKDFRIDAHLGAYFYWVNTTRPPLDDVRVRQALSYAMDREAIVKYITRADQIPMASVVPNGLAGYESPDIPLFDPEKARQLLADAGYPDGKGLPSISLVYNTAEGHKKIAEAVKEMWRKHLNIDVDIENLEWKVYLKKLEMMDFHIARMGWIGDYQDPYTFLDTFLSNSGNNHSGWADPHYDQMLKQANQTLDRQQRLDLLHRAESYALQHQPVLPIYTYTRSQLIKNYVQGIWPNVQDRHPWKYIWIDERWYDGVPSSPTDDPPRHWVN